MNDPVFCEACLERGERREATHRDSVPDPNTRGYNLNECGYRWKHFCLIHAMERRAVATARVEPLQSYLDSEAKLPPD